MNMDQLVELLLAREIEVLGENLVANLSLSPRYLCVSIIDMQRRQNQKETVMIYSNTSCVVGLRCLPFTPITIHRQYTKHTHTHKHVNDIYTRHFSYCNMIGVC
jgi:hypothetical protein